MPFATSQVGECLWKSHYVTCMKMSSALSRATPGLVCCLLMSATFFFLLNCSEKVKTLKPASEKMFHSMFASHIALRVVKLASRSPGIVFCD